MLEEGNVEIGKLENKKLEVLVFSVMMKGRREERVTEFGNHSLDSNG
jgi:hypothetical protein